MVHVDSNKRPKEQLLRLFPLMALIFYEVSGGPFGCEDAVGASSPIIAIIGFIVFPIIWSIPEALITAEMAVMYPEDCGYVAWVANAFGPFMGFIEGLLSWVSGMADNALYPVLAVDYFRYLVPSLAHGEMRFGTIFVVTVALTYLNYRGLVIVGRTAVFLTVFCMLPFVALVCIAMPQVDPQLWQVSTIGEDLQRVHWASYMNTIFWNVNYWDSVSTLAGEVHDPARTIPKALMLAVVLMVVAYVVPLMVGTGICIPTTGGGCAPAHAWKDGYFSKVAAVVGGKPLQGWLLLAAALSNIGCFEAEMCSDSYQILGMADRGFLPAFCARRSKYGTPTVGILMSACGVVFVAFHGFGRIVEMLNFLYCLAALLEFAAFLSLRWHHPEAQRGFRIPLPFWGCCLMLVPPTVMIFIVLYIARRGTVTVTLGILLLGCCLYVVLNFCKKRHLVPFLCDSYSQGSLHELAPLLENNGSMRSEDGSQMLSQGGAGAHHRSLILAERHPDESMILSWQSSVRPEELVPMARTSPNSMT